MHSTTAPSSQQSAPPTPGDGPDASASPRRVRAVAVLVPAGLLALVGTFLVTLALAWHDADMTPMRIVAGSSAAALVLVVGIGGRATAKRAGL